jgi:DNA polymerase III epsilon subunit-like protein
MTRLCFIDTETTSLRPDRRAWEIGIITRDPSLAADGGDVEYHRFVDHDDLDLGNADLQSLKIGRFYDRHPYARGTGFGGTIEEYDVMLEVEQITRGAHLVGAVPNFDAEVLGARMREHGICPSWHYHLIDVETLAAGYLASMAHGLDNLDLTRQLPWNSDALSAALGITVSDEDRHTALGDARWARAIYDAVSTGK